MSAFRRGGKVALAVFAVGCGRPPEPPKAAEPAGTTLLEARGVAGAQTATVAAKGKALRVVFEAVDADGASLSVRLVRVDDPNGEPRSVQGTCRPDEPFARQVVVRPGGYTITIHATGAYRMRVEEP